MPVIDNANDDHIGWHVRLFQDVGYGQPFACDEHIVTDAGIEFGVEGKVVYGIRSHASLQVHFSDNQQVARTEDLPLVGRHDGPGDLAEQHDRLSQYTLQTPDALYHFLAAHGTIHLGEQVSTGTFEDGHERLQFDLQRVCGRDEVVNDVL